MQSEAPADAVHAELTRVSSGSLLAASPRRAELLRFLVEQTLDGHGSELKESVIAAEIYRNSDYDPKRQAIVRSEIRRLRLGLLEHYASQDALPSVRIEIPKAAIREDSTDARAWSGLAEPHAVMIACGPVQPASYALRATDAADRAIRWTPIAIAAMRCT